MIQSWSIQPSGPSESPTAPASERLAEARAWSAPEAEVAAIAPRLRAIVRQRLGESLPTDGSIELDAEHVLWVHGFRFKLTERGDTLMAGRLYPQAVRMDVTHPHLGVHVDGWRPGGWQSRVLGRQI